MQKLDANQAAKLKRSSLLIAHILHGTRGIRSLCDRIADSEVNYGSCDPCSNDTFCSTCEEQWHLENSVGPPVHCTEVQEELPKLQGDNVCATGDHTMVLATCPILQDCGSRCERLQRASAWEIDLSPCQPSFCWHTAGTQLAIRGNCRNRNIRNAWRRGGVKTQGKKDFSFNGKAKRGSYDEAHCSHDPMCGLAGGNPSMMDRCSAFTLTPTQHLSLQGPALYFYWSQS